jgi:hypothetical protein
MRLQSKENVWSAVSFVYLESLDVPEMNHDKARLARRERTAEFQKPNYLMLIQAQQSNKDPKLHFHVNEQEKQ